MDKQERQILIDRFEGEMAKVKRPGVDKLMEYIRKSDFYTAPASTKYHLCTEGGLLQHSLNVLDALRGILIFRGPLQQGGGYWEYCVGGKAPATYSDENVIITALLHDICKTFFYKTEYRNVKNDKTGKWEKAPYYAIEDRIPLGHGAKSAMIIKQYMELETPELYAIWWHMGFNGQFENDTCTGTSIRKYPLTLALITADLMAAKIMEAENGNETLWTAPKEPQKEEPEAKQEPPKDAQPTEEPAAEGEAPVFEETTPVKEGE